MKRQKKPSETESGRKTLRFVTPPPTSRKSFLTRFNHPRVNRLTGNARRPRGQLEELPGQREEAQGKEEQELPEASQSEDGAAGMKLSSVHPARWLLSVPSSLYCRPARPDPGET